MAVQIRYFLESRCKFEYWQVIKKNTNIASESLLSSFCICIWLFFFNLTYFEYLYQDTTKYFHKDISFNEVWLSKHLFFVFFDKNVLLSAKCKYFYKDIWFNEVWL
jgi:hypothetical protein